MAPRALDIDRIGSYRILRAAEATGSATYVAREEGPVGFRRDVLLTIANQGDPAQATAAGHLAERATIGSRLNHPHIVRTYNFFGEGSRLVLVEEHVEGMPLADLVTAMAARGQRLSDAAALHIGVAVLEALSHAHAQVDGAGARAPVVHGRVAATAIRVGKDGTVKIGGFGASHAPGGPLPDFVPAPPASQLSAPPVPNAGRERDDVFAAGRVLYELLTGRAPSAPLESLASVRSDLPRELAFAVDAALDVNAKRAIGCAEMASWIKKVARLAGGREELRDRVSALAPPIDEAAHQSELGSGAAFEGASGSVPFQVPEGSAPFQVPSGGAPIEAPSGNQLLDIGVASAPLEIPGESARIPLAGWTVRLAPMANKMFSAPSWTRLDALVRARAAPLETRAPKVAAVLHRHPRAAVGAVVGALTVTALCALALARGTSRPAATALAAPNTVADGAKARVVSREVGPPPAFPVPVELLAPIAPSRGAMPARPVSGALHASAPAHSPPHAPEHGAQAAEAEETAASTPLAAKNAVAAKNAPAVPKPAALAVAPEKPAYTILGGGPKAPPPPPKGFGYLTVHSSIPYAFVYVQMARYGHVERRLTVRCGKRFLSLGAPKPSGGEPTWFAPSRTVDVPCGDSIEISMMPKWIP